MSEAVSRLENDLDKLDHIGHHGRLVLLSHAQAGLGRMPIAKSLYEMTKAKVPDQPINDLRSAIGIYYGLGVIGSAFREMALHRGSDPSSVIQSQEFLLAMAA